MEKTAVEFLVEKLKSQGLLIGEPDNLVAVRQAKEMEKEQFDDYAIEFADWLIKRQTNYFESLKQLLEIFKKENQYARYNNV